MAFALILVHLLGDSFGLDNGLGLTPQMGWSTWNHFGCEIDEQVIKDSADEIVNQGLKDLGYIYVNIDDCWANWERSPDGKLVANTTRFPNGMKNVTDYIHSKGLKAGIYSDAGTNTCAGQPGSLGHEKSDANQFAEWGFDYLKYDNCYNKEVPAIERYIPMRDALNATKREIFFSICDWGVQEPWIWGPKMGNSWRTTDDIKDSWDSLMINFYLNSLAASAAGPGGWNDPDMLEVGNGGLNDYEYQAHFSLWALVKAPLIIGCNLKSMTQETLNILGNKQVININQDKLGVQATCRKGCNFPEFALGTNYQVLAGPLENGDWAVGIINWGMSKIHNIEYELSELGIKTNSTIKDLWENTSQASTKISIPLLKRHHMKLYRVSPQ